jgi:hypothetical protein
MTPELHRRVREVYQATMTEMRSEEHAFDRALLLLIANQPEMRRVEARRLVARMLAQEPLADAAAIATRRPRR